MENLKSVYMQVHLHSWSCMPVKRGAQAPIVECMSRRTHVAVVIGRAEEFSHGGYDEVDIGKLNIVIETHSM